jgi:hypothetical protein
MESSGATAFDRDAVPRDRKAASQLAAGAEMVAPEEPLAPEESPSVDAEEAESVQQSEELPPVEEVMPGDGHLSAADGDEIVDAVADTTGHIEGMEVASFVVPDETSLDLNDLD